MSFLGRAREGGLLGICFLREALEGAVGGGSRGLRGEEESNLS